MTENIQIGIDIATSISIIGAAISFLISQRKIRLQSRAQYALTNLMQFLDYIKKLGKEYDEIGNSLRISPSQENLQKNILQIIFFIEDLKREIHRQNNVYFPLFSTKNKASEGLIEHENQVDVILIKAKAGKENFIEVCENIEPLLNRIEDSIATELKEIIKNG